MKLLSKVEILGAQDLQRSPVEVPEWGVDDDGNPVGVLVRMLTAAERDAFEASVNPGGERNLVNFRARLCALCIVDSDGQRIFRGDAETKLLGEKSATAVNRIFDAARKLNGMTQGDVEELEKNSSSSQGEDSSLS